MIDPLTQLANQYKSDKGSLRHQYTEFYHKHLSTIRYDKLNILEIGVNYGSSIQMWLDYFPHSTIYGLDLIIDDEEKKKKTISNILNRHSPRFFYYEGDQGDINNLELLQNC
jgi:hypothetical protein